jgi:hypothetical protein
MNRSSDLNPSLGAAPRPASPTRAPRPPSLEAQLAPDVDPTWAEDFILALRLDGVDGAAIGAALAEVNDHVRSAQVPAATAFGPAARYARNLGLPPAADQDRRHVAAAVAPVVLWVVGLLVVPSAVRPIRDQTGVLVTWGMLVYLGVVLALMAALTGAGGAILAGLTKVPGRARWAVAVLAGGVVGAALLAALTLLDRPAVELPPWPVAVTGAALLVVGVAWQLSHTTADDPIEPPRAVPSARRTRRFWPTTVLAIAAPVVAAALCLLAWFTN